MKKSIKLRSLYQAIKDIEEVTAFLQLEIPKRIMEKKIILKG